MVAAWHPMEPAGVEEWWAGDDVVPWVLEVDGEPVGYGELWLDAEEDEVELARLIVPEPLRGQGYGGLLTVELTAAAARTGLATTMLRTTEDNTVAIACYAARGFVRLLPRGGGGLERGPAPRLGVDGPRRTAPPSRALGRR